jgi:hypothetical protein
VQRYFLIPIHTTPLLLVATFTFGLWFACNGGILAIPMGLILLSWFCKYCFVLFDSVVAGEDEPPVLSMEMVNPVSEQRPLALALIIAAEAFLITRAGPGARWAAAAAVAFVVPAHIGVLGLTRNVLRAVWPPALLALISRLRSSYLLVLAVTLVSGLAAYAAASALGATSLIVLAVIELALLLTFALVAGAVFEHRLELGIDSKTRQERLAERAAREHAAERGHMLDTAYTQFRLHQAVEGWGIISRWLSAHSGLEEYRAVLQASSSWDDARAGDKVANELVALLLAAGSTGEAVLVVERRLASNPGYRVAPAAFAVRLAELAGAAGKKGLQRRLSER